MKGSKLFRTLLILALVVLAIVGLYPTFRTAQLEADLDTELQRISDATGTPVEILREDIFRFDVDLAHRIQQAENLTAQEKRELVNLVEELRTDFFEEYDQVANDAISLGLDLQGGMHLVLEVSLVDLMDRLARNTDQTYEEISDAIRQRLQDDPTLSFNSVVVEEFERQDVSMARYFGDPRQSDTEIVRTLQEQAEEAVDLTLTKLRNRIDEFGVSEPSITRQGARRIVVELPGVQDPSRARDLIGRTALLEFQLVADAEITAGVIQSVDQYLVRNVDDLDFEAEAAEVDTLAANPEQPELVDELSDTTAQEDRELTGTERLFGDEGDTTAAGQSRFDETRPFSSLLSLFGRQIVVLDDDRDRVEQILGRENVQALIPPEYEFLWSNKSMTDQQGREFWYLYLLQDRPELTGDALADAQVTIGSGGQDPTQAGQAVVNLTMKREGARTFSRVTENNIGNQLAIVLDEKVHMAPNIRSRIPDGRAIIEGLENVEEAQDISIVLRAGALPAPVDIIEERTVGPSLGAESIDAGTLSAIAGLILVMVFMVVYYGIAGLVADLALILNMLFILSVLGGFGFTLTLPGIAGIILTIGMAVDANVLVFERIREERRAGRTDWNSVKNGFDRATLTILDANITTLIAAIVLYQFGTGPIRGFALTLMIGIAASVFTALVVSRAVFDAMVGRGRGGQKISLGPLSIFESPTFNFMSKRRTAFVISGLIIVVGLAFTVVRGGPNYSIDFTGGTQMMLRFDTPVDEAEVRDQVFGMGYGDAEVKTITGRGQQDVLIRIPVADEGQAGEALQAGLQEHFPGNPITVRSVETVGPKIGHELRNAAILAVLASLFFIVIYISWRFRYRYAIASLAALAHDVLIVFGLFSILNLQISLAVIAAFLTIVGYSLNDTIVVFDRIRENVKKLRAKPFFDQVNISINETLSRTVLTSGTTLLVVLVLYFFGGSVIHDFAFALLAGVLVGTYSSVFVASPILVEWEERKPEKKSKKKF